MYTMGLTIRYVKVRFEQTDNKIMTFNDMSELIRISMEYRVSNQLEPLAISEISTDGDNKYFVISCHVGRQKDCLKKVHIQKPDGIKIRNITYINDAGFSTDIL